MLRIASLIVLAFASAAATVAGPAGADVVAGNVTFIDRNYGPIAFAEAQWETRTASTVTDAFVLTAKTHRDNTTRVFVELRTTYLDANGQPTGGVDLSGGAAGVQQTFDEHNLTNASVDATVPATSCTLDADGNPTGCADGGTLSASAVWTGRGPISRTNYEDHFHVPASFVFIDRANGPIRLASATATIGGEAFDASSQQVADMGVNVQLVALICPHGC